MVIKTLSCNKATLDSGSWGCVCVIRGEGSVQKIGMPLSHVMFTTYSGHWSSWISFWLLIASCCIPYLIVPHAQLATISHYITEELSCCLAKNEVGSIKLWPLRWKYVTIRKESIHPNAQHAAKLQALNFLPRISWIKAGCKSMILKCFYQTSVKTSQSEIEGVNDVCHQWSNFVRYSAKFQHVKISGT